MNTTCIQRMREELEKTALPAPQQPTQTGKAQQYLPWYGAAGMGAVGHHLAGKVVPKKFKFLGQLAGTLAGTGVGVHGGEALGKKLDMRKTAEGEKKEKKPPHPAATLGKHIAGFGTGMGAGYLAARGANEVLKRTGSGQIPPMAAYKAIPIISGLGGLAYTTAQQRTLDKMRKDHLDRKSTK